MSLDLWMKQGVNRREVTTVEGLVASAQGGDVGGWHPKILRFSSALAARGFELKVCIEELLRVPRGCRVFSQVR